MKINIYAEDLKGAIDKLEKVLVYHKDLDILNNILVTTDKHGIYLTVNNLESILAVTIPGDIEIHGQVLIHKDNFKTIKKLTGNITITGTENNVTISGKRSFEFTQGNKEKFPNTDDIMINDLAFKIPANEFKNALRIKVFAAKNEDARPVLMSVNIKDNKISATDGFRAAEYKLGIDNKFNHDISIPLKSIEQLDKIIDKKDKSELVFGYQLKQDNPQRVKYLSITGSDWKFITRIIDADYMILDNYIPKEFAITNKINKKEFAEVLSFIKDIYNKADAMTFEITKQNIKLIKQNETQKVIEEIAATTEFRNGIDNLRIGFNDKFMLDIVNTIDGNEILFNYQGTQSQPLLITNKDLTERYLVLPIKID